MKHTKLMAIGTLLLLGVSGAAAQSLGDYARAARKKKPESTSTTRHYDNDNLPTNETLSVVGPPPPAPANAGPGAANTSSTPATKVAADPAAAAAERKKTADELTKKLDQQKQKIDSLNRELDIDQREHRLRAAAFYGDAGTRLRNSAQYDKDDAQYKSDVDGKQKAVAAAQQELDQMQEQARKAGIVEKDKDKDDANDKK
jgi:hypothetical protein